MERIHGWGTFLAYEVQEGGKTEFGKKVRKTQFPKRADFVS